MKPGRRFIFWTCVLAGLAALFWFKPLFHVLPIAQTGKPAPFDAKTYVEHFWTEKLIPAKKQADDVEKVLAAIQADRKYARKTYSRNVGMGGAYSFFVTGSGTIVSVDKNSIGISLSAESSKVQVALATGFIFGNAVRDGTGLINVSSFSNLQDYNAVSEEINRRIEEKVLPELRRNAAIGKKVYFAGCAEILDEETDLIPLRIIPFIAEFADSGDAASMEKP